MLRFLLLRTPLILIAALLLLGTSASAQCPQIEAIMVDACGTEQLNEFVVINSGGGFNTADIQLSYDANNNILSQMNNDINIDINNFASDPTPCGLVAGNTSAFTGCPNLISVGPGVNIPANSIVVLQTSAGSSNSTYNFASLCGAGQCVYVIASACTRTAGGFTNAGAGLRTTIFQIAGGCNQTIIYNQALITGGNGGYYLPLTNMYGNGGCFVPPTSPAGSGSSVNQPPNITVCAEDAVNVAFTGTASSYDWTNNNVNIGLPASGTGDLNFTAATVATVQVATITVTPGGGSCPGTPKTFTITVRPLPVVNPPADVTVCAGAAVNVPFTGTAGATYAWTNDNPAVGLGASGNGTVSFTSANVATQQIANITVTPTLSGCPGNPQTFSVTVNPKPQVDDPPNITVCANEPVMVPFTGTASNYNWTNNNVAIGLGASGSGDLNFTANNVLSTQTGTITVNPVDPGCAGPAQTFTITVSPAPTMNQPANITVCGGATVTANFSGGGAGATYNWLNDNTAIGLADMGTGNLSFVSANVSTQEVAIITVAVQVGTCPGPARTFTITINPTPTVDDPGDQSVCAGDLVSVNFTGTANTYNWTNNNTATGLAASGSNDILFVGANVATAQTGTITLTPVNPGCPGLPVTFTLTVNPAPLVNQPPNITVCAGAPVNVNFTGTAGATFGWTNNNTTIGLGASGSGNISFTGANVAIQQVATITVTPDNGTCPGNPKTFTITVNPAPSVNDPADELICAGEVLNVAFSGTGTTYSWTNSNVAIGLPASGNGNIGFAGANVATTQTGTITVTPNAPGCPGIPQTFTIAVSPIPTINQPANITVCAGAPVTANFSGSGGPTFTWTNNNTTIGLGASGSGNISFNSAAVATQQVATITVTPDNGACPGTPLSFTVTVNPAPTMTDPADITVCPGLPVSVNFMGSAGATFTWTNSNTAIGQAAAGAGNISFIAANVATTQTGTIVVTPAGGSCPGIPQTFTITVQALPVVQATTDQTFCNADTAKINFSGNPGTIYNWTNSDTAIGLPASGTGNIVFVAAVLPGVVSSTVIVTPSLNGCTGMPDTFTITVVTAPTVANPGNIAGCANQQLDVMFTGLPGTTYNWTNDNPAIGLPASGSGDLSFITANVMTVQTAQITVTPQLGTCTGTPEVFSITINLPPGASISGSQMVCAGDSVTLTANGGGTYAWESSEMVPSITVTPDSTTTYTVTVSNASGCTNEASFTVTVIDSIVPQTIMLGSCNPADTGIVVQVLSSQFGCDSTIITITSLLPKDSTFITASTCDPSQAGTTQILLTGSGGCDSLVITTTMLFPKDSINITKFTCNPNNAGMITEMLTNQFGCDSIVITTTIFDSTAIHSTFLSATTCDPAQVGTTQMLLSGADGCDSLVITTTTLLPSDSINLTQFTCHPGDAGTTTQLLSNQFGCDSIVVTTTVFDPALIDSTQLAATTCDPTQVGTSQMILSGSNGCDSIVITTTTLLPGDTTNLTQTTCDPNNTGTFTQVLSNQSGCDSTIITMVVFDPALLDTTQVTAMTCDPSQVGVTQMLFNGSDGCDSLVITTTTLSPSNTTNLSNITCDPNAAGMFTQILTNQFGCDSTVITTVIFDASLLDVTQITATTCDPSQVGVTQMVFNGSDGCDSTVVTTTTLSPSNTTNLNETTCHPNDAGVFTQILVNQFGCDSTVITTVVFDPALIDTTQVNNTTCDPTQAGTTFQVLTGVNGCDSVIVTTVAYDATLCAVVAEITPNSVSCAGGTDGSVSITVSGGQAPFQYNWTDGAGNTGTGQIAGLNTPTLISGLAPGNFAVTVTQASTGPAATLNANIPAPLPVIAQAQAVLAFNSFSISCPGASDGSASGSASGGTAPYQYNWSSGASGTPATGLAEGDYTLTVSDQNNCTAVANVNLSAPPPLDFSLQIARPDCGALVADATVSPSGGVGPYTFAVDGNTAAGTTIPIDSGTHLIEITDNNGCVADSSILVNIQSSPLITLPADTFVYLGESLTIEAVTNLTVWKSLNWQPTPDTSCLNCLLQTWMPLKNALYTVSIVDTFGCDAKASIKVIVRKEKDLYVPNVFSPDGNGVNDLFQINGGPSVLSIENLHIYDRWGNAVYIWDDPIEPNLWPGWDGTVGGKKAALGVYVYYLKIRRVNGETEVISGDVTLARQ